MNSGFLTVSWQADAANSFGRPQAWPTLDFGTDDILATVASNEIVSGAKVLNMEMKCVICRQGETRLGTTTITLEPGAATLVFKNVPAQVCENCGEAFVDQPAEHLLQIAEEATRSGVLVDVREYTAAAV